MSETIAAWVGVGLSAGAAVFAFLAWEANRPRTGWHLSPANGSVALLKRNGLRRAELTSVSVPHQRALYSTDARAVLEGRVFRRHDWVQLDVHSLGPGEVVVIEWRTRFRRKPRQEAHPLIVP